MNYRLVEMVLGSSITDATETAVLIALAFHADKYCSCFPSIQRLCQLSRYKERAVQGAVKRLAERGVISVRTGGGRGGASFYTIHPNALNPAANAPINADKPRSKCAVVKEETPQQMRETPQQMRETPHLTTENPAANAPEHVIEPVKNPAVREAELGKDRIPAMRDAIVSALGLTGRELNTSGTFVVAGMDARNVEASLIVWSGRGLTDEQIISAIRAKIATERGKDARFMPRSIRFFDGAISDFAKRITAGSAPQQTTQHKPDEPLADPKAEAERQALMADLDRLRGSNSDAAFNRRREIVTRLQYLQTAAGA